MGTTSPAVPGGCPASCLSSEASSHTYETSESHQRGGIGVSQREGTHKAASPHHRSQQQDVVLVLQQGLGSGCHQCLVIGGWLVLRQEVCLLCS